MKLLKVLPIIAMLMIVFMDSCKKDENPGVIPTVTSTVPSNNATIIAINSKISATFSVAMDPSTITNDNFTLMDGTTAVAGVVLNTDTAATFTPTANLSPNTLYTATITTGVKEMSGGNNMANDFVWTFTTGEIPDLTAPTVISTIPANNATGVGPENQIVVTFSENMDPATISAETFTLKQGVNPVAGTVTHTDTSATFTPANILSAHQTYTATITTGAKDMSGNALAANFTFSFTCGDEPDMIRPTVISTNPVNHATGVSRNKVIAINFSEDMDPSTIGTSTFTLKKGSVSVSGTVTYSDSTALFNPNDILLASTTYNVRLSIGAKDLEGNTLASAKEFSFTTGSDSPGLKVVNLGSAINYVILAKTGISNISISAITGNLGLSPAATSYITGLSLTDATGYATSAQVTGKLYAADMADPTPMNLTTAVENMITAYNDAAGRPSPDFLELGTGNIGGLTLAPGLYKWTNTVTIPSDVTISGSADDVWIFQIAGDLSMSSAVNITLVGGAQVKNIFWQVAGQATIGTTASFKGIILSMTGITFQTGAAFKGRALAQTAVVLDGNAVTKP